MSSMADLSMQLLGFAGPESGLLIALADLLIKSAIIVLLARYFELDASPFFSSIQKRALWGSTLLILLVLPVSSLAFAFFAAESQAGARFTLLVLDIPGAAASGDLTVPRAASWVSALLAVYLLVLALQLTRLVFSILQVQIIRRTTDYDVAPDALALLNKLRISGAVNTSIQLGINPRVQSPVTFGVIQPVIVLPDRSYFEDSDLLSNVIVHELGHIRRHDTLLFICSYLFAALNWFNPFVWYALGRLNLAAEFACDDEVLRRGDDRLGFATQLLTIARSRLPAEIPGRAARAILSRGQLLRRVNHILCAENGGHSERTSPSAMPLAMLAMSLALFTVSKVVAVGEENWQVSENLRLLRYDMPVYPEKALERGLSGFSQYSFDVTELGRVDMDSIQLLRTSHGAIFEASSLQALESFQFAPRIINGRSVPTSDIRYTFNYQVRI